MEELTLQLSLAQQSGAIGGGVLHSKQQSSSRSSSSILEQWVTPVACASAGMLVGAALATLFLSGPSSRAS